MARYDPGEAICARGRSARPDALRRADPLRQVAIGDCLAERDGVDLVPDLQLERSSVQIYLEIETLSFSRGIFAELILGLEENSGVVLPNPIAANSWRVALIQKVEASEFVLAAHEQQWPEDAFNLRVNRRHNLSNVIGLTGNATDTFHFFRV